MKVIIEANDTLWGIAERYLGDGSKWLDIWQKNSDLIINEHRKRLDYYEALFAKGPGLIFPGMILEVDLPSPGVDETEK